MGDNTSGDRRFFPFVRSKRPPGFRLGSRGKVKMMISRLYPTSTSPLLWIFHFEKKKKKKTPWLCAILSAEKTLSTTTFWSQKNNEAFLFARSWWMMTSRDASKLCGEISLTLGGDVHFIHRLHIDDSLSRYTHAHISTLLLLIYKNSTGILSPFVVPTLGFPALIHFRFTSFNFSSLVSRCKHSFNVFPSSRQCQTIDKVRPLTHS